MAILDKIKCPKDLKILNRESFTELACEIRQKLIKTVSKTGGHLAPSLGTVELTIALHYVYNSPHDKIIWDVGHQAYTHKLLTGRCGNFDTLRTYKGISGFPKRSESEHDAFGVGHSSTAISAALGFAVARDIKKEDNKVIAVVGDGSMTGGLSFEGLLNAGHIGTDLLVILNDNEMFISHRVGALAGYLTKLLTAGLYKELEKKVEQFFKRIHFWGVHILRIAKRFKVLLFPGMLFEEMGFAYLGPVDGHDTPALIDILNNIKKLKGPVLLHVITKKGKGYSHAESDPAKFHGLSSFDEITGDILQEGAAPTFTSIFGDTLVELAKKDSKIIAITAAMSTGTGLDKFSKVFPERFFDVGIAEGHALTFAAGLASEGMKPVCVIYSTFLQRAIDQMIHDIALQNLPVVLAVDRAGIVGEDGPTHHGNYDLSFMKFIPNFTIMAPSDENELRMMLKTSFEINGPVAIRYPRGSALGVNIEGPIKSLEIGKANVIREGKDLFILSIGSMLKTAIDVSEMLIKDGISCGVADMRYLKPMDEKVILNAAKKSDRIAVMEENTIVGGFGESVDALLSGTGTKILKFALPDRFIEHGNAAILREEYGLSKDKIIKSIKTWMKK